MLKPDKHTNLRLSIINVSGVILKILKDTDIITFDELLNNLSDKISKDAKEVFFETLSFLFLLGKIEYHEKLDSFELKQ